jgi:hypothetical protein
MMIVNDHSRVINKLEASLTDDARLVIYDLHMFIVQATGINILKLFKSLKRLHNKLECLSLQSFSFFTISLIEKRPFNLTLITMFN